MEYLQASKLIREIKAQYTDQNDPLVVAVKGLLEDVMQRELERESDE